MTLESKTLPGTFFVVVAHVLLFVALASPLGFKAIQAWLVPWILVTASVVALILIIEYSNRRRRVAVTPEVRIIVG